MSKMTKSLVAASVLAATVASGAAMAEVSMNIGVTSNYIWRGVTQTNDEAAVSGGIDYSHDSGFYLGAWASSLGNGDSSQGASGGSAPTSTEFDYYGGFSGSVGEFGYDISVAQITYPQLKNWDFTEVGLSGSYSYFTVGVNSTVASDVDDTKTGAEQYIEGDNYYYASVSVPLQDDYSVGATYGSYKFEDDGVANTDLDYTHYQLSVTKSAGDFGDVTLAYDKNDMDDNSATDYKEDSGRVSVSWSKSF